MYVDSINTHKKNYVYIPMETDKHTGYIHIHRIFILWCKNR